MSIAEPATSASPAGSLLASILSDDSFRPAEPKSIEETGLTAAIIENLILKYVMLIGSASGRQCADNICLPFGLVAGYFGGLADMVISRLADALLACPFLVLAIALAAFLGPSLENAMIAIGISAVPVFVRVARAETLVVGTEDYIAAARSQGLGHLAILTGQVLPNVLAPVIVQATLTMAIAVLAEASLAFLGLGQLPPAPSWGAMLDVARQFLGEAPWMAFWPGLAIIALVIGFNLMGDGLNDALNPRH